VQMSRKFTAKDSTNSIGMQICGTVMRQHLCDSDESFAQKIKILSV